MTHIARHTLPDVVFLLFGILTLLFFMFTLFELIKVFNKKQNETFPSPPLISSKMSPSPTSIITYG